MKIIGRIFIILGMYFLFTGSPLSGHHTQWSVIVVGFIFHGIGLLIAGGAEARKQNKKNEKSKEIVRKVLSQDQQNFGLYLRTFEIDGKLTVNKDHQNIFDLDSNFERIGIDPIERVLGDAVNPTFPLVGLGEHKGYISSVGHVGILDDWEDKISVLIEKATAIFIIPAPNKGTIYEIGLLLSHLNKTIFIMPPGSFDYEGDYKNMQHFWESATTAVKDKYCIALPEYSYSGGVFRLDSKASCIFKETFFTDPRDVAKAINEL